MRAGEVARKDHKPTESRRIQRRRTIKYSIVRLFEVSCSVHLNIQLLQLNVFTKCRQSDEGDTSSSSENEGKISDREGPCCQSLKVPPSSPICLPKYQLNDKKVNIFVITPANIIVVLHRQASTTTTNDD